jgi:hypothetical protein
MEHISHTHVEVNGLKLHVAEIGTGIANHHQNFSFDFVSSFIDHS